MQAVAPQTFKRAEHRAHHYQSQESLLGKAEGGQTETERIRSLYRRLRTQAKAGGLKGVHLSHKQGTVALR